MDLVRGAGLGPFRERGLDEAGKVRCRWPPVFFAETPSASSDFGRGIGEKIAVLAKFLNRPSQPPLLFGSRLLHEIRKSGLNGERIPSLITAFYHLVIIAIHPVGCRAFRFGYAVQHG